MFAFLTNNLVLPTVLIGLFSLIGLVMLVVGIYRIIFSTDVVKQRMRLFVEEGKKTLPTSKVGYHMAPRELRGSFFNRTLTPLFQRILGFFGKYTPTKSIAKFDHDLRLAGNPHGLHAREYYGIRMILLLVGFGLAFLIYSRFGLPKSSSLVVGLLVIYLTFVLPGVWLNRSINARKAELSYNLPNALDMLSVCAVAGLSFEQGLKKICEFWSNPLTDEFKQVLQEIDMGISRAEALRNLRNRINLDSLSSFIAIMIQAETTGMNYAEVLENEAKQMRIFRQYRAKEQANALPAKLMVPVSIFIFPAIIAIIVGPLLPTLMGGMFR